MRSGKSKILIFTFLSTLIAGSICTNSLKARTRSIHPNTPIKDLVLKQWQAEDGLISNNLTSVAVGHEGFIWITCFNGLLKFDGHSFELFDSENLQFLSSNAFMNSFIPPVDSIVFSTQASGIVYYKNGTFRYPEYNKNLPNYIRKIFVDDDGRIWAGSNNRGLYTITRDSVEKVNIPGLTNITVMDIVGNVREKTYVATWGEGLYEIADDSHQNFKEGNGLYSDVINCLYLSKDNSLYVGTNKGLNRFRNGRIQKIRFFENIEINQILEDDFGSIWVATEMGLGRINTTYRKAELFTPEDGLPTRQVSGITFDHEGNLWLSMKKGGLLRLKYGNFINYNENDGLALDQVNIIVEKSPGLYYVGSDEGGINIISNGIVGSYPYQTNLNRNGVRDICFVDNSEIWIGSYLGILIKKGDTERLLTRDNGLPADDIRRIFKDSRDQVWVGTRSGGLIKFKADSIQKIYDLNYGFTTNYILSIEEDAAGTMWIGTNGGGLYAISQDDSFRKYNPFKEDASGILIFNIHIDAAGDIWLATNIGVYYFDRTEFVRLVLISNAQNDTFFDIVSDDTGYFWFTSNIGLYRVSISDVESFLEGGLEQIPTALYDHNDGMRNKECTGATRSLKATNGKIWIPTLGGVSIVDPENLITNTYRPPVIITDFLTDRSGEFLSEDLKSGYLVLDPGNFRYQIKFTALSFQAPEKVRFRYRLLGIDKEWIETKNIREVQYTNLPPGRYTFKLTACNNDNLWNEEGASFTFRIKPFLYQRTEVYISLLVLSIVLGWLFYRRKVNVVENRNKELNRINEELDKFVYSASHDLKAPLNSVLGLVNIAKRDGATGNMPLYLKMIEQSIKKLERFISDIIDYSRNTSVEVKSSVVDFKKIIDEAFNHVKYIEGDGKIEKMVEIDGDGLFRSDERRISVILNNLIANAVIYHDKRKEDPFIKISVKYNKIRSKIIVEDNGIGIGKEHLVKIFKMFYRASENTKGSGLGLYIVKETLLKIKGSIQVESDPGKGTKFIMDIPSI